MAEHNPLMSGVPELLILRLLAGQEMYGYALAKAIRDATRDAISVGEGVLYPALHLLEMRSLLRAKRRSVGGRTRVYYAITSKGRTRLERLTQDWNRIAVGVEAALAGAGHG
jgi:PadR family transcriptional regulator PadR